MDVTYYREAAARAFTERRLELGLTQERVAREADVVVRTVVNFETQGRWPNSRTRAALERAVDWPDGEISRIASARPDTVTEEIKRLRIRLAELEALEDRGRDAG